MSIDLSSSELASSLDYEEATRGHIADLEQGVIKNSQGRTVWDATQWSFLKGAAPETVNADLWHQSQLCAQEGLFEVTDGVYQLRGVDLSNMTVIEGDTGVVIVDPLVSTETAAAGLALYRKHRGDREVKGVIYTHCHFDHFGGVLGVVSADTDVPIVAPEGFMEHAVTENVYAGTAMLRRGVYFGGVNLDSGTQGPIGMGLGQATSTGTTSLLAPTVDVTYTGQELTIDGVRFVFQLTPGTEAPAEMNFLLPERRAMCMAENATHTMHNVLTLRGAVVRDPRIWAHYLNEVILDYIPQADVVFASHHWPTWGHDRIIEFLTKQRDMYQFMHDQTLRLMNQGYTGIEIAEMITMPGSLDESMHTHGYYGSLSHNVKAIYQRYMGWFDGNPSSLWEHPPVESAKRYVDCIGGIDAVLEKGKEYIDAEDYRFAAQLLKHAVFAEPDNTQAKELLAQAYEQLGYGAQNGIWRNFYLTGAQELRGGATPMLINLGASMATELSVPQIFDSIAIRIDGKKAESVSSTIDWIFNDSGKTYRSTMSHGALIHWEVRGHGSDDVASGGRADLTFTLNKMQLLGLLGGRIKPEELQNSGDITALSRVLGVLDDADPNFAIVTP